ncbi:MAG: xisH [bacterium]|nr:MAG: xisH [bacterium]
MPQLDLYHNTVRNALIKDGWTITHDPFLIQYKGINLYADLAAEKAFAAERQGVKIAIEVKVFASPSLMTELEKSMGQYIIYRSFLMLEGAERTLYLAITQDIYQNFFLKPGIQDLVKLQDIKLLVFDPKNEEVVLWIS